jgi:hypothetical protein
MVLPLAELGRGQQGERGGIPEAGWYHPAKAWRSSR